MQSFIQTKINVKTGNKPGSRYAEQAYIIKAVSLLGNNSLRTVDIAIVQNILNSYKTRGGNRHLVRAYRSLFDFIGRMAESKLLRRKKFPQYKPPFLTKEQVAILADVPEDWKKRYPLMSELILITFNVAGRISESLAIEKSSVQQSGGVVVIVIDKQWVRKGDADANHPRLRPTKNKSTRKVLPIDAKQTIDCLTKWLKAYPKVEQRERYRYGIDRYIRKMCREKFGINVESDSPSDDTFFDFDKLPDADADRSYRATHMLRAGHAVHMTALTGNTKFVADQLGDTEKVVMENYVGRVSSAATISEMAEIIKRKS